MIDKPKGTWWSRCDHWTFTPPFGVMLGTNALVLLMTLIAPRLTPPGNVWELSETISLLAILSGTCIAARRGLRPFEAFVMGAMGAGFFDVWLPDSRDYIAIGMGRETLGEYLRDHTVFIVVVGAFCAVLAPAFRWFDRRILHPTHDPGRCRVCDYDLRGLPEPRCPECGTPFEQAGNTSSRPQSRIEL